MGPDFATQTDSSGLATARLKGDDRRLLRAPCGVAVQVLVQFPPALPKRFTLAAHRRPPEHVARRIPPASSTTASGWACRFNHKAGSGAPQPFMAMETRSSPSS